MKIFLASSMFGSADTAFNLTIKQALSEVATVVLPQEGPILADLLPQMGRGEAEKAIFDYDLELIDRCDLFLIVLDGMCVDEGAAFELGFAYAKGKTCLGYLSDWRKSDPGSWRNPMTSVPLKRVFSDFETLKNFIRSACPS